MEDGEIYQPDNHAEIIEGSIFDYYLPEEKPAPYTPLERLSRLGQLPDEEIDLAEAALMVAALEYSGLDEVYYLNLLDDLADEVRPIIATETDPLKSIERLNYFLSELKGFRGNEANYGDRRNSYFNDVLTRRTGIPITLSLLYIELGKRLGLHFEGIGLPGHFIIRYRELAPQTLGYGDQFSANSDNFEQGGLPGQGKRAYGDILLDPFNGGNILTEEECVELVRERYGRVMPLQGAFSRAVTNKQFLTRMLTNLKVTCLNEKDFDQALQIQEALVALNSEAAEERRDRGLLYLRMGRMGRAISDLQYYLRKEPTAPDANSVRQQLRLAFDDMVKRN